MLTRPTRLLIATLMLLAGLVFLPVLPAEGYTLHLAPQTWSDLVGCTGDLTLIVVGSVGTQYAVSGSELGCGNYMHQFNGLLDSTGSGQIVIARWVYGFSWGSGWFPVSTAPVVITLTPTHWTDELGRGGPVVWKP